MDHPIHRVRAFEHVGPYTMRISFDDRSEQVVDFGPVLAGELYGPLKDRAMFNQARLDPEAGTLVWPNGADFDPAVLHDWPDVRDELATRAAGWGQSDRLSEHSCVGPGLSARRLTRAAFEAQN